MLRISNTNEKFPKNVGQVNAFLSQNGYENYSLVKGNNYYYFVGVDALNWDTSSVMVNNVSQLSFSQWLDELKYLIQKNSKE